MAQFIWSNGNQGFHRPDRLDDFERISTTAGQIEFRHDGDYDPTSDAYRMVFLTEGRTTFRPDSGPMEGQQIVNGGRITGIRMFNEAGQMILEVRDLNGDLASFESFLRVGEGNNAMRGLMAGGHTFTGSNNGAGPQEDWDGDDITSGGGNDTVNANAGDDYIKDFGGSDSYVGGTGFDVLSYDQFFWNTRTIGSGIVANLATGRVRGPDLAVDRLQGIEGLKGTHLADRMIGDDHDNVFIGLSGRDVFDGAGGFDWVSYRDETEIGATTGVRVNLAQGIARDDFGMKDRLTNIEGARGTDLRDTFRDDAGNNWFNGQEGNDTFTLSRGNDAVEGEDGADRFIFVGATIGEDEIRDFSLLEGDRIKIESVSAFSQLDITQDDDDALITCAAGTVRLKDFDAGDLTASAFIF